MTTNTKAKNNGTFKTLNNILNLDFLQGSKGPIPINKIIAKRIGPFTLSKNGLPIVITVSSIVSENTGKIVPHNVTSATIINNTF